MILKKITATITAIFFTIAITGCSSYQANSTAGSSQTTDTNETTEKSESAFDNVAMQVLGYALGFAIGAALADSIQGD